MGVLEFIRSHALALPHLAKFALAMAIIVGVPPLSRRLRLPPVVGLLLCGVVIGPHVLACIIHDCEDTKSLFCYKHVVETWFAIAREAFACSTIARHSVCCSPIFSTSLPCCSSISVRAVPMAEPCC